MNQLKIALCSFWDKQEEDLAKQFPDIEFLSIDDRNIAEVNPDALLSMGQTSRALDDVFSNPETKKKCSALKWVHVSSAGIDDYSAYLDNVDFTFTCGKIIQGPNVGDHGMALLLALSRRLAWYMNGVAKQDAPRPTELRGKRALVIGSGGIGLTIAERCSAFGMKIDLVTEVMPPLVSFVDRVFYGDQLLEALPDADVVFSAIPETPQTYQMLNTEVFVAMKESAYFINVSRGTVVDIEALTNALEAGQFEGVGLDVTDPEPLPDDHRIRKIDRVLITPHAAGMSTTVERRIELIHSNIRRFLSGNPLINVVDKSLGF